MVKQGVLWGRGAEIAPLRRWRHPLRLLAIAALVVGSESATQVQVSYVARSVTSPNPQGFFNVPFTTCSDGTNTLPSGGYIKGGGAQSTSVNVGGAASVTGFCDVYLGTTLMWTETRNLDFLLYYQLPPGLLESQLGSTHASNGRQSLDTSVGPNGGWPYGSGPVIQTLSTQGEWKFRFRSQAAQTSCSIPMYSSDIFKTINAVTCEPKFYLDSNGNIGHLATGVTTEIYLDPTTLSGATNALQYGQHLEYRSQRYRSESSRRHVELQRSAELHQRNPKLSRSELWLYRPLHH